MKIKWLVVLFIFFLGAILLSLLIVQQSQKVVSLSEKEITITRQAESRARSVYSPAVARKKVSRAVVSPLGKSGITIIKTPSIPPEEKNNRVSKIATKAATNNVSVLKAGSSTVTEVADSLQTGITKTGKQPTSQELQEMNSSGIVLY
jgi:hypothetical protein